MQFQNSKIYCDLDGVLCDFWSSVKKLTDRPVENLSMKELWILTRQHADFWGNLGWLPDAQSIWNLVERHDGHVLSSLPYTDPNSRPGKLAWLENNLRLTDSNRIHLVMRHEKQNFATSNGIPNILIDDYLKNITEWQEKGGIGILHTAVADTMKQLKGYGIS